MFNVFDETKKKFLELMEAMFDKLPAIGQLRDMIKIYFAGALDVLMREDLDSAQHLMDGMAETIVRPDWWPDESWKW